MGSRFLVTAIFFIIVLSCNTAHDKSASQQVPGKSEMTDLNRFLVRKDRERIESYIERKNLKMKETPSGLWYLIVSEGTGEYLTDKDTVEMEYECSLLDGTLCYSSRELGPKEIILGKTSIESGLDQGLRMIRPGSAAVFILPPFMAYGLPGDGKKIPSRAVIVYNVRIRGKQQ
ncbi:MAG: FKBP-type peptidyl-prolyl cis-trans isomerase [Bacteroidales bacterium]